MPKCDFNKVAKQLIKITLRHGCSPVNLLHAFQDTFSEEHLCRATSNFCGAVS